MKVYYYYIITTDGESNKFTSYHTARCLLLHSGVQTFCSPAQAGLFAPGHPEYSCI